MTSNETSTPRERRDEGQPVIVVGYSFSTSSELALDQALSIASLLPGSRLHVVWALGSDATRIAPAPATAPHNDLLKANQRLLERVSDRLAELHALGVSFPAARVSALVRLGDPAQVLDELAFVEGAHLVVVGSSVKSTLERMALGDVAKDVLTSAPCPVLVARPRSVEGLPQVEPSHQQAGTAPARLAERHHYHSNRHEQRATRRGQEGPGFSLVFPMP